MRGSNPTLVRPVCRFLASAFLRASSVVLAVPCAMVAVFLSLSPAVWAQDCDRNCLESVTDQFLSALEARDPTAFPRTDNLRYTENGQDIALGDGLWQTFVSNSDYRLYVADPHAGQVVFLGVIQENDAEVIAHFRLKVEQGRVAEAEALLARNSSMAALENLREPKAIFMEPLPAEQRVSREQLLRISDSYFTGLDTENSGAYVPFHENCQRQENGLILANSPDPDAGAMQKLGCKAQFDTGFSTIVTDVRERRYMVLDEERGLSYAIVFFDHNGTAETMGTAEGEVRDVASTWRRPSTIMIGELFKIVDGNIRQIEAIIVSVPYGMPSGWDGEDLVSEGLL